ncbi:MAG: Ger(x)C family spore germination protein [Patescibacteria group bacterium]
MPAWIRLLLFLPGCLFLTGCWDLEEVDHRAFATTIGIDAAPRGRVLLSAQIPMPQRMLPPGSQGGRTGKTFNTVAITGETVRDAFGAMQTKAYRWLVIQQNKSVVLGEAAARAGATRYMDWLSRSPKAPPQALVYVADGRTAREILDFSPQQETLPGLQFIRSAETESKYQTNHVPVWLFRQKLVHKSKDPYAPLIGLDEHQGHYVQAGLAVFSSDRLAGKLGLDETAMFSLLTSHAHAGVLSVALPAGGRLTLRNFRGTTEIEALAVRGMPFFVLRVKVSGAITEMTSGRTRLAPRDVEGLERAVVRHLRPRLAAVVRKLQRWNADVIDLGEQLRVQRPALWRRIDWRAVYPAAGVRVEVEAEIKKSGVF